MYGARTPVGPGPTITVPGEEGEGGGGRKDLGRKRDGRSHAPAPQTLRAVTAPLGCPASGTNWIETARLFYLFVGIPRTTSAWLSEAGPLPRQPALPVSIHRCPLASTSVRRSPRGLKLRRASGRGRAARPKTFQHPTGCLEGREALLNSTFSSSCRRPFCPNVSTRACH